MKTLFPAFLCAAIASVTNAAGDAVPDRLPPGTAKFISKHSGKPPAKSICAALVLTNRCHEPLWFILPCKCDEPPALKNPLHIPKGFEPTWISADGFNTGAYYKPTAGSQGETIRLTVLSVTDDKAFCLFRLPSGGRVEFESYIFEMRSEYVRSFRVWTASEIRVNCKKALQAWLPYKTLSALHTVVPKNARSDNLNFDATTFLGNRSDFHKEPIRRLDIKVIGTWKIPFKNFG